MDEAGAREIAKEHPGAAEKMGLDSDIPPEFPAHTIPGIGELRRFPSVYVTPYVRRMIRLHNFRELGSLRATSVLHWPPRFVAALETIDAAIERKTHVR